MTKDTRTPSPLRQFATIEEVFALTFRRICEKNHWGPTTIDRKIDEWLERNIPKGRRGMVGANLRRNLENSKFSHKTFITAIQVLNVKVFDLELHLHYDNPDKEARGGIDSLGEYTLAQI